MRLFFLIFSSGLALADEPAPKSDEGAAPTEAEAKPAEAKPAEAKPAEAKPPAASGPPIVVEVSLKNGLKMRGTMAASAAANWKKGQPMALSVQGAKPTPLRPIRFSPCIGRPRQAPRQVGQARAAASTLTVQRVL
jgi:hypothetical protein